MKKKPLNGINILDLTQVLSGPFATLILSDLGANIFKVEKPDGDDSRKFSPLQHNKSGYFISLNRGKKSIILDLKDKKDKKIFCSLIKSCDVLIENFSYGILDKFGFSWRKLKSMNSRLIYSKISGFGSTGPMKKYPAYDVIVQAMGGIMSITGNNNQIARVGSSIGDIVAGLYCVIGILSAIIERHHTKMGKKIDISMLDCQVAILENAITKYSITKKNPKPLGSDHPSIAPFGAFKTKDSEIVIAAGNQKIYENLCEAISRKDMKDNHLFYNNNNRSRNIKILRSEIEKTLKNKNSKFWLTKFKEYKIPCSSIEKIKDVFTNPQVISRNMILKYFDNDFGEIKVVGNPIKFDGEVNDDTAENAPELNEHKDEIMSYFKIKK
tara:strand:+ start:97 stop:1245 length:1149 start_codon:yes stop_codon:yes gene_type:complete